MQKENFRCLFLRQLKRNQVRGVSNNVLFHRTRSERKKEFWKKKSLLEKEEEKERQSNYFPFNDFIFFLVRNLLLQGTITQGD